MMLQPNAGIQLYSTVDKNQTGDQDLMLATDSIYTPNNRSITGNTNSPGKNPWNKDTLKLTNFSGSESTFINYQIAPAPMN